MTNIKQELIELEKELVAKQSELAKAFDRFGKASANAADLIGKFEKSKVWPEAIIYEVEPTDYEIQRAIEGRAAAKAARYARINKAIETWEQLYQKKLSAGTITRALQLLGQEEGFIE